MTLDPEVNNTESAMTLAQAYLDAGNYRRAEEVLKSALTESPQDAMLLTAVALAQHLLGDYAAAERTRRAGRGARGSRPDAGLRGGPRFLGPQSGSLIVGAAGGRRGATGSLHPLHLRGNPAQRRRRGGRPARGHRVVAPAAGRCRQPQHGWHGPLRTRSISRIDSGVRGGAATGAGTRVGVGQHRCE